MSRLPTPGGDSGNWGVILNDYLSQSLQADGTLKPISQSNITGLGTALAGKLDNTTPAKAALAADTAFTSAYAPLPAGTAVVGQVVMVTDDSPLTLGYIDNSLSRQINAQTGTTYTFILSDTGKLVTATNASAQTYTVPLNSTSAFPVGSRIDIVQLGAGAVTIAATGGVTIRAAGGLTLVSQYTVGSLEKIATDEWLYVSRTLPAPPVDYQQFTSSGTWTKPTAPAGHRPYQFVEIFMYAGGSGGGSGRRGAAGTIRCGGGGGAGGGYSELLTPISACGATESVAVGTGGSGGAAVTTNDTNGSSGAIGGKSSFGNSPGTDAYMAAEASTGGSGGTATTGSAGVGGAARISSGTNGGAASATGGVGSSGGVPTNWGAPSGASGGGITSGDSPSNGGGGVYPRGFDTTNGGSAGTTPGGNGGNGTSQVAGIMGPGYSGGGGAGSITGIGGTGGDGGLYGAGGGGGGASLNGNNSGAGGNGSPGIVVVITR